MPAQLYLLIWAGKTTAALAGRLLQTRAGMTLASVQTAIMLALSFAGWVPIAAWLLPRLGEGDTALVVPTLGRLPEPVIGVLAALPTGWGYGAVAAARDGAHPGAILLPLAALLAVGAGSQAVWIALTARALRRAPRRASPRLSAGSRGGTAVPFAAPRRPAGARGGTAVPFATPQVSAVVARELATWLRDPARGVELRTAWLTPLLMAAIIAFTGWSWAVPLVGPAAAVFGAMAAINTYALDGTALWQLLTTPGALKADVRGRMAAWALLFGLPSVVLAAGLQLATGSPVGQAAIGGAVAAAATGCATAPLLALLMPAVGADARARVHPGQQAGDPTGGQMTIFPVTLLAAVLPGVAGGPWWVSALVAVLLAAAVLYAIPGWPCACSGSAAPPCSTRWPRVTPASCERPCGRMRRCEDRTRSRGEPSAWPSSTTLSSSRPSWSCSPPGSRPGRGTTAARVARSWPRPAASGSTTPRARSGWSS
ncbi:hypothetical protein ACFQ0B_52065 [Nonomuraea thailandensis]